MENKSVSDVQELLRLLQGDEANAMLAYQKLYDTFAIKILRAANKFLRDEVMAEDLVQDVFLSIWQKRQQLQHVENLEPYLYGIVKKLAARSITNKLRFDVARIEFTERVKLAEDDGAKAFYEAKLQEIVNEMPEQRRTIFRLAKIDGLSYEAIAQKLGISIHTVNHNITKALQFVNERKHDIITLVIMGSLFGD
jgi:RNA polymerase sigma-70 factor (ECF subfamily)